MQTAVELDSNATLFSPQWRNLTIGAVGLCSMIAFEAIGIAAGMPAIAAALDGIALYALAFAGTLAGSIVAMVWSGTDCDRQGPYRSMAWGMGLFAVGLLIAGLAHSMTQLVVGRVIQGLGSGAVVVALYVATARTLPTALHPRLFALFSSSWVVPAIVGPAISGWIVEHLGWRWLFLGILGLLLPTAALILPPLQVRAKAASASKPAPRLHWPMLAAVSSVTLAISSYAGNWAVLVVLFSLAAMLWSALRLLPIGTLRFARGLPTIIALRGLNSGAFFLCEAFIPLWLHQQRGWSITAAGMALTGGAVSWSIGSYMQSRIASETRRHAWLRVGCAMLCIGIVVCAAAVLGLLPEWTMLVGWSMAGFGVGLSLPMLGVLMLKLAPHEQQGSYSSALQLCATLCTSAALAAGGLWFSLWQAEAPMQAFLGVYALAALLAATAWVGAKRALPSD